VTEPRGSTNAAATINGREFSYFIQLAFDASSQLTLFGVSAEPAAGNRVDAFIERIDMVHGTQWRWLTDNGFDVASALDMMSGSVLVAGGSMGDSAVIMAIASDGRSCQRFSFDAPDFLISDIATGPAGEVWFVGVQLAPDKPIESHLGRLERLEL
jgi:hypothetical protein